jgi:L-amino acid N-acyltransferase YncA
MSQIIVRKATEGDAAGIANVHINSWRESYKKLLPKEYLRELPLEFNERYELWLEITAIKTHPVYVAEHEKYGIVGFTSGGEARDEQYNDYAEIYSIYLLKKFHGHGTGYSLLKNLFADFVSMGHIKSYVWVLNDNNFTHFYERTGAYNNGDTRIDTIGNKQITSLCYEWNSLVLP